MNNRRLAECIFAPLSLLWVKPQVVFTLLGINAVVRKSTEFAVGAHQVCAPSFCHSPAVWLCSLLTVSGFPICRLKLSDGLCFQTQDNYTLNGQGCPVARNLGCTLPLVSEAGLGGCSPTCGLGRQYSVLIQHSPHLPGTESFLGNLYAWLDTHLVFARPFFGEIGP